MRRRRTQVFAVLAVAGLLAAGAASPASASFHGGPAPGTGQDCNSGRDASPSSPVRLTSGSTCNGNLDNDSTDRDTFEYHVTDSDIVAFNFGAQNCQIFYRYAKPSWFGTEWDGPNESAEQFLYEGSSRYMQVETFYDMWANSSWERHFDGCENVRKDYSIVVTVYPNTRPVASLVSGPSVVLPGEPYDYAFRGTDANGNLAKLGVPTGGTYGGTEWWTGGSGSRMDVTKALSLSQSTTLTVIAEDSYGSQHSAYHAVTVREDDCGTGDDIATHAAAFPFTCRAHLWTPLSDYSDAFEFDVTEETDRVMVSYTKVSGDLSARLRLLDPAGVVAADVTDASAIADASVGRWRLEVDRLAGNGRYDLGVRGVGPAAPPELSAALSPGTAIHQGEKLTLALTASDPNDMLVTYRVDWGDGAAAEVVGPVSGAETTQLSHTYATTATAPVVSVTATNEEGLTDSAEVALTVQLHRDCGVEGYDAPATTAGASPAVAVCQGTLGYPPADGSPHAIDLWDTWRIGQSGMRPLRMTLTVAPGLNGRLVFQTLFGARITAPFGGAQQTISLPAIPPGTNYVIVEWAGGKGSYTLEVS